MYQHEQISPLSHWRIQLVRLNNIKIRDFKRFADLNISNIPQSAKLVLLTGPNGSGKTSLFEAFNYWMHHARTGGFSFNKDYHLRSQGSTSVATESHILLQNIIVNFHNVASPLNDPILKKKAFYLRSAYRHEPDFTSSNLGSADDILEDTRRPQRLINQEQRVSENYQRMVAETVEALYSDDPKIQQKRVIELSSELIGEVRDAMKKVFGDLVLEGPGNPLTGGTFRFRKGDASGFHYKNLSGGEKAAFDLLLDFIVKRRAFDNTVYCIDEPELHMHTRLQAKLLEVMFELIPDNCQLWLSTHSIGMARKAAELNSSSPGEVAFLDFHDQNFDGQVNLEPIKPDRKFWKQMFHTALDDLAELVVPRYVVFCEGKRLGDGGRKPSFDVEVYRTIFGQEYPDVEFIPLGGTTEVQNDGELLGILLTKLAPGIKTWKVFDRDDRHSDEVEGLKSEGIQVLQKRDLESYLWNDEILKALCAQENALDKIDKILSEKQSLLTSLAQQGKPSDDIKAISGPLYNKCKQLLGLTQCGNNAEAFARLTLAPLVTPDTQIYQELRNAVLGPCLETTL